MSHKCISLWQPYASLVVTGAKKFETRSWSTKYRGPLLIHAAKKTMGSDAVRLLSANLVKSCTFPLGAIIGSVELVRTWFITGEQMQNLWLDGGDLVKDSPSGRERAFGDYTCGRFAWELRNPVQFKTPIPFRGMQQIFNVPAELMEAEVSQ